MRKTILLLSIILNSCGPKEEIDLTPSNNIDTCYVFKTNKRMVELEETTQCEYGNQFTCPNCEESFNGQECEHCNYSENR